MTLRVAAGTRKLVLHGPLDGSHFRFKAIA
jgi:hypothetical protein